MKKRNLIIGFGIVVIAVIAIVFKAKLGETASYGDKYAGANLSTDVEGIGRSNTYNHYLDSYKDASYGTSDIEVDVCNYTEASDAEVKKDFEGESQVLYTGNQSDVTWKVNVPEAGFYNVYLEYYTVESRGIAMERSLQINGELPFLGADTMTFSRKWVDGGEVRKDNRGNDIRPAQKEEFAWLSGYCRDYMGYEQKPFMFYFTEGENDLSLIAVNEPMVLRKLTLKAIKENDTYEKYQADNAGCNMTDAGKNYVQKIQGEDSACRSDASLYAKYDKSAPNTEPYSVTKTTLNYIGSDSWKIVGQWIEWEMEVPEDGYYKITVKARQNFQRGSISSRCLYIDGEIPFDEVKAVEFDYSNDWEMVTLADDDGTPYEFYLEKGTHTLRLEATLGKMAEIVSGMQDSIYRLNEMYRKILVLTSANPDKFRDYNIDLVYPEVITGMDLECKRLYELVDESVLLTGQKSDKIASALTLATQLEKFVKNPDKIAKSMINFKDNIAAMGTALQSLSEIKLDIDYIVVNGTGTKPEKDEANVFEKAWHETKAFGATFVVDYDSVGNVYDEDADDVIEVWLVTGRDQSEILKTMVDDTFTPDTGVKVNVQLIQADALLSAVVAGNGPDVVLSVEAGQPVNYALRNAVEDLTQFEDFDEVMSEFLPSSYRPYTFEGGVYAIPETQNYNVLFYRKDILDQLGVEVPQTWDDLIAILPTIQGSNMSVAIPTTERLINNLQNPDLSLYFSLVYQNGGVMYDEKGIHTRIDEEPGIKAFETYNSLFADYGLPKLYDFVSRFRSGEMPLGIDDYSTYNTLVVSAPEIKGLWDFTLMPGTLKTEEDGTEYIDRSVHCWGVAAMMIANEDENVKQNAWEFLKWWASSDSQARFGRELESVMGSSARYATANTVAFEKLAWSAEQVKVLNEQRDFCIGFQEVAGGYYTPRHITNACRKVTNELVDERETLLDYTRLINEEIEKKREEYGLAVE